MSIHGGLRAAAAASPPRAETRQGRRGEVHVPTKRRAKGTRTRLVGKPSGQEIVKPRAAKDNYPRALANAPPRRAERSPIPITITTRRRERRYDAFTRLRGDFHRIQRWEKSEVHVSKTVTMLCVDFAARDPVKDCTAVATTVQFVAREA